MQGTVYQHTFANAGSLLLFLPRTLRCRHDWRGQCFGWLRTSRAGQPVRTCRVPRCARLAFISRPTGSFTRWAVAAPTAAGNEFIHPFEYDPAANSWTTKSATYPDNQVNNMACGVLSRRWNALHLLRGRLGRRRDYGYAIASSVTTLSLTRSARLLLPGRLLAQCCSARWLHGLPEQALHPGRIRHHRRATGPTRSGSLLLLPRWVQKAAVLPVPLGYIPTTTIGTLIYTGGGSDITAGALTDTTNSFVYNPVADTIGTIASIPRATGETRALNFNGQMWVMGGGRTAPNPSNEVDIYDPVATLGQLDAGSGVHHCAAQFPDRYRWHHPDLAGRRLRR